MLTARLIRWDECQNGEASADVGFMMTSRCRVLADLANHPWIKIDICITIGRRNEVWEFGSKSGTAAGFTCMQRV